MRQNHRQSSRVVRVFLEIVLCINGCGRDLLLTLTTLSLLVALNMVPAGNPIAFISRSDDYPVALV